MNSALIKKIIIGSWSFSGDLGSINKKEIYKTIEFAIEKKLNTFDTAPSYNNGKVDKLLSKYKKSIIVNTKCGYNNNGIKTFKSEDIEKSLYNSLKLFDKINIFYLHSPRLEIKNWDRVIDMFNNFKKDGLIKYSGISIARDHYFSKDILNQFDYIQDEVNLLRLKNLKKLKEYKCKIVARSPLANGLIKENISIDTTFSINDYRKSWCSGKRLENIIKQITEIKKIYDGDISDFAQSYLLQNNSINFINFGVKNINQVKKLLSTINNTKINIVHRKKINHLIKYNYFMSSKNVLY